jgi:hypothetical protein
MVGHSVPAQLNNTNSIVDLKCFTNLHPFNLIRDIMSKHYYVMHLQEAQKPDKKKSQNAICLQFQ